MMLTRAQALMTVATMFAAAGAFSCSQRRNAERDAERVAANQAVIDSIAAAAQANALLADGVATADPNATVVRSSLAAPVVDTASVLSTLAARETSTYLGEILTARDGMHFRWPDRAGDPMRIWVQEPGDNRFDRGFPQLVRDGFSAWDGLGLPFTFTFVRDSSRAEIIVTWVDRFDEQMTGRTNWQHDRHGWIVGGTIEIARHQPDGVALDRLAVAAIARHEVGHLIGLDHTRDKSSIMAPTISVFELSEADRRTARLAYDLPPGRLPRQ
jgi:hypothetical protein